MTIALPGAILDQYPLSARFRTFAHVVWARHSDATVLLDAERGLYYTLNEVAGRAWELLIAGEPLIEVLHVLGDEYDVPAETLQDDVAALLRQVLKASLVERMS